MITGLSSVRESESYFMDGTAFSEYRTVADFLISLLRIWFCPSFPENMNANYCQNIAKTNHIIFIRFRVHYTTPFEHAQGARVPHPTCIPCYETMGSLFFLFFFFLVSSSIHYFSLLSFPKKKRSTHMKSHLGLSVLPLEILAF
jgi:hypothetical protein